MRSKKALTNAAVQIILEICTIISGFIIPKMIIGSYGSETNGLIVSITQFFGYLTLLQTGIGGVAKASLYRPLAENDNSKISALVRAMETFFRKIGLISIAYLAILICVFPTLLYPTGNVIETVALIVIIWIGVFAQYYFGMTYQLLLQADQNYYIYSLTQILVIILNTLISVIMINTGFSIYAVKLVSSSVFLLRPILLGIYCRRKYSISKDVTAEKNLIKQRFDGFGHTVAYFIQSKSPVFILTMFSSLNTVSVYSVYYSIASAFSVLLNTVAVSVQSAFGNMIAKDENDLLKRNCEAYLCANNLLVMCLFSTAIICIIPFMRIYTSDFSDANYIVPTFSAVLMISEALYCIRLPYQTVILAAGHYKQTRNGAFIEAAVNVAVSLLLVNKLGLTAVAIATASAMLFRTAEYINYLSKHILYLKQSKQYLYLFCNIIYLATSSTVADFINSRSFALSIDSYPKWIIFSASVFVVSFIAALTVNCVINAQAMKELLKTIKQTLSVDKSLTDAAKK